MLFDVIQTISDGKCKAVPTKYEQIASLRPEGLTPDESAKPAVRLVELTLMRGQTVLSDQSTVFTPLSFVRNVMYMPT